MNEDEIKARYGGLIETALLAFANDGTYAVTMMLTAYASQVRRDAWTERARRKQSA